MIQTRNSEINIEELKQRIRLAVERREAEGEMSFAKASADLSDLLAREDFSEPLARRQHRRGGRGCPRSALQPESSRRVYHVNDLPGITTFSFSGTHIALKKRDPTSGAQYASAELQWACQQARYPRPIALFLG
jgi:hypothetical protein